MSITRKRHFDLTVTLDGQPVRLVLKRMTVPQFEEFQARFTAMGEGRGEPDPGDLSQAALDARVAYLVSNATWLQDIFAQYVTVRPGDVVEEGDEGSLAVVTDGRQFSNLFSGDPILAFILSQLYLENRLNDEQKKSLQSRSGSDTGLPTAPATAAAGETPVPTAGSAGLVASAPPEAATALNNGESSGTTFPLSSGPVPCAS